MSAWPQFVPRIELDVHLKSIEERFSQLFCRIAGQEDQTSKASSDVELLTSRYKDLALKAEVQNLASRLDLQFTCTDSSIADGLQEVRSKLDSQVHHQRDMLQAQIKSLHQELSELRREVHEVEETLSKEHIFNQTTYATKAEQASLTSRLEKSADEAFSKLSSSIQSLSDEKATCAQLDEAKSLLWARDDSLADAIAKLESGLAEKTQSLVELGQFCRSTYASQQGLADMSGNVVQLDQRMQTAEAECIAIVSQLDNDRDRLREGISKIGECLKVQNEATSDIVQLRLDRAALMDRCSRIEDDFSGLRQLESQHCHESQDTLAIYQHQFADLHRSHEVLRLELQNYIESAQEETEKIRQYSTMRYLDQLDKALALQTTVEQVQKGQQELCLRHLPETGTVAS